MTSNEPSNTLSDETMDRHGGRYTHVQVQPNVHILMLTHRIDVFPEGTFKQIQTLRDD